MNINNFILVSPLGSISGIILFLSVLFFSANISSFKKIFDNKIFNKLIYFILTIIALSTLTFYLAIIGFNLQFLRSILILFIIINFIFYIKNYNSTKIEIPKIFILIIFILFLLALLPPLDADSLDYHFSGPLEILKFEKILKPSDFYWLHFRLLSSGEMMSLLGLALGSYSFGQLIQFSGLIIILINFLYLSKRNKYKFNYFIFILSLPILISLISSHKPTLFQSSIIFTSIVLCLDLYEKYSRLKVLIIFALLEFAVISKISFIIPAIPVFLFALYIIISNKKIFQEFLVLIPLSIFLLAPLPLKNYLTWGEPLTPFYHFYDHEKQNYIDLWLNHLVVGEYKSSFSNIFSSIKNLIIPFKLSEFSQVLGIGFLSFIFLLNKKILKKILKNKFQIFLFIEIFFILISLFLIGKGRPRFYLEIYLIFGLLISINYENIYKKYILFNYLLCLQLALVFLASIISIYFYLPGSFNHSQYDRIMNKYSHQYEVSIWINEKTKKNSTVLYNNLRSRHAIKRNLVSFFNYDGDFNKFLKKNNVDYVVFNDELKTLYNYSSLCLNFVEKKRFKEYTKNFLREPKETDLEIFKNKCK